MSHPYYDVVGFEIVGRYTLRVAFDDGSFQVVDLEPILVGELFAPLRDPEFFRQVRLDPEIRTLVWRNGADFDPYVLHEWPRLVDRLALQLRAAAAA